MQIPGLGSVREQALAWKEPLEGFHSQRSLVCGWTATASAGAAIVEAFFSLLSQASLHGLVPGIAEGWAVEGAFPNQGS